MTPEHLFMTVGTVVDTNDPQQNGRLRVSCPKWGDTDKTLITDLPWATYVSPFGGVRTKGGRGPENVTSSGPVSYGMWAIPKVGATVVCMLLDGDVNTRLWLGCIPPEHMVHTMPAGRYLDDGATGPVTSTEQPLEPLATNQTESFGPTTNPERLTRGGEGQVGAVPNTTVDETPSSRADDRSATSRTGYQPSRLLDSEGMFPETGGNFDPQTYSITTPGMHSFIMDDSLKNGKIRIRSTSGNQIILDDTNERIYISTSNGKNYIEMDSAGNIDIYAERRISVHAKKDINFTTEETFRVSAKNIHMRTSEEMRFHADTEINALAGTAMRLQVADGPFELESTLQDIDIRAEKTFTVESTGALGGINLTSLLGAFNIYTGSVLVIQALGSMNMTAGGAGGGGSGTMDMVVDQVIKIQSNGFEVDTDTDTPGDIRFNSGATFEVQTQNNGNIYMDTDGTGVIQLNGGFSGTPSTPAAPPVFWEGSPLALSIGSGIDDPIGTEGKFAYTVNRVPIHEPWGRISNSISLTDQDASANLMSSVLNMTTTSGTLELSYTSGNANKVDLGDDLGRNDNWRR